MRRRHFLNYSLLFLAGCAGTAGQGTPLSLHPEASVDSSRPTELKFAVTDIIGLEELEQNFEAFRQQLEVVTGIPITFYPVPNYLAAAPALLANDLDLALAGPSEYLLLRGRAQAEPLVQITRPNYYSVIVTRKDSGMTSLADLNGKTVAMRAEGSTAGHIFPMKLLIEAGVNPDNVQIQMLDKKGLNALMAGEVDAWADSHRRYIEFAVDQGLEDELAILSQGDLLPGDIFVANPSLGPKFIQELRLIMLTHQETLLTALASSKANAKYQKSSVSEAQDGDYDAVRRIYRAIGLESAIQ
ncbi:MAG: PhnD/SsuA/transferrin family substrate-binding protein [Merismopedia sp. SIO2A8]|nr:PhnD/SsuA/transferrin family substrate-binding protein [Symploca sp. SIO2B6]NET50921.1 PhnD/SsuA/transferrin family substrate-binding protein [Merismopedia sp. SIO2A8]